MPEQSEAKRNGPLSGAVGPAVKPQAGYVINSSAATGSSQERVRVYVDGFNLYYGLHEQAGRKLLWLDLHDLSQSMLKPNQVLAGVHYFTARRRNNIQSQANQAVYLNALRARGVDVIEGRFQEKSVTCRRCGHQIRSYEEKESDVSFCVRLLEDAVGRRFDVALLVTADSDMVPAVQAVKRQAPSARLIGLFPPKRESAELRKHLHATMKLGLSKIRGAQLPDPLVDGTQTFHRPTYWV